MAEKLTISIFHSPGVDPGPLLELCRSLPDVQLISQASDPGTLLNQMRENPPDLALVSLNGVCMFPDWLESFVQATPKTAVLVCCNNRKPEFLIQAMRAGVRECLPVAPSPVEFDEAVERLRTLRPVLAGEATRAHVIAVTSHTGGAGVTSVAVNLASALAAHAPGKVALVDLGRPFADLANFLNQEPEHTIQELVDNLVGLDLSFVQGSMERYRHFAVLHGPNQPTADWELEPSGLIAILSLLRVLYDWVVLDLGHWPDELQAAALREADIPIL